MAEAAAITVLDKISQGHLECPICCCRFKDPKILDCLHSFCLKCLEEMLSKQKTEAEKITCPVCRRETKVPDGGLQSLTSSSFLSSLLDDVKQQEEVIGEASIPTTTCDCKEDREATWRCLDCSDNLCKKCWKAHGRRKSTKNHQIISFEDWHKSNIPGPEADHVKPITRMCTNHTDQALCFYCDTCHTVICPMCAAMDHRSAEHSYKKIDDSVRSFRRDVDDALLQFEKCKQRIKSTNNSIELARDILKDKLAQARIDISANAEIVVAKIRNKAKLLTEKVDEIGQERDRGFEKALTNNCDHLKRADQIATAVNDLKRKADGFELLELKPKVMRNLEFQKELNCEPAKLDMAFIGVKCQDVVSDTDLGEILLKEKWPLKEEFGKKGNRYGEFLFARGVACFSNGDIAVTDTELKRLSIFTSNGRFKLSATRRSHQLDAPLGVAVNTDDLLFVTDKKKVKVFDNNLCLVREFTPSQDGASELSAIAVDKASDRLAVADSGRKVISVHLLDGSLVTTIPNENVNRGLAMNNKDRLYIPNYDKKTLSCVDLKGNEVFNIKTFIDGSPASPVGVLFDDHGYINVTLHHGSRGSGKVQQYNPNGFSVRTVAEQLYNPLQMAYTPTGDLIVADRHSIKIFQRMWFTYLQGHGPAGNYQLT
ncbi:tripartite motif-containing protein 2-like [Patiria miniata]|uniref:Uncharacterized protein n=1 Tax=Patiria miniata TaxID=46514 RepID=A0A913ZN20_PATMI|nr:tripartite motif-containing protein 2-like [Patiria miniata]